MYQLNPKNKQHRREFLKITGSGALAATLFGCDKASEVLFPSGPDVLNGISDSLVPGDMRIDLISHALNRLTYGPAPGEYDRIRRLAETEKGCFDAFLEEQLGHDRLDDLECEQTIRRFETLQLPIGELFEYQEDLLLEEVSRATLLRAVYSKRQLYEVMVNFWSDHFNIDSSKGDCRWLKVADDREVIRKHALGKFPEMLRESALSPAMLWYLDGRVNRKSTEEERPNENYARELLELHTLGVHGGYTQLDVMEAARCLTGWTVRSNDWFKKGAVEFKPEAHDDGEKVVLGEVIPAGLGEGDLDYLLEIIALHPSTAEYLATKLCRRFISDDPPVEAVDTTQSAFLSSGGDIPCTLRALFATEEFRTSQGQKLKRPFGYLASALRVTGARTLAEQPLWEYLVRMGQAPFQYPTPDGYPDTADPWLGTLFWRWKFAVSLCKNEIKGTRIRADELKKVCGNDECLMAHFLGRLPNEVEKTAFDSSEEGMALMLSSPAFQRC